MAKGGNNNPEGKGGLKEHPENIKNTKDEFTEERRLLREIGESSRAVVDYKITVWKDRKKKVIRKHYDLQTKKQDQKLKHLRATIAYIKSLEDIKWYKETMDRQTGKAIQPIAMSGELDHNVHIYLPDNKRDKEK